MEVSEIKKSNKYTALVTYLIAVVCLLLGLFLPLFDGKGILALQLPDVFNKIAGKEIISFGKQFTLSYGVDLFGLGKFTVDIMAWIALLYAVVTVLSLLSLIPIGISTKKGTGTARIFMYVVETAAVIVLSLYFIVALNNVVLDGSDLEAGIAAVAPSINISYNMIIALCGPLLALIILSCMNKKSTGAAKLFLFLFSAIGLLALYNIALIIPKLSEPLAKLWANAKIAPLFYGSENGTVFSGINHLQFLFENKYTDVLSMMPDAKTKAALVLGTIVALVAMLNYFIDVIGLSSNAKRTGLMFNLCRYALEAAALFCLIITAAVCKYNFGLLLIILSAALLAQLIISIARYCLFIKKAKNASVVEDGQIVAYVKPVKQKNNNVAASGFQNAHVKTVEVQPEPVLMETVEKTAEPEYVHRPEPVYNIKQYGTENEYAQKAKPVQEVKPEQEIIKPVQEAAPVQEVPPPVYDEPKPVQQSVPVYEPVQEVKPEPTFVREVPPVYAPAPEVKPEPTFVKEVPPVYAPAPEVKPEPVRPAATPEPAPQTRVYTINTIYGGPTDEFINKLTNDEKIEFAMTFIEKSKGPVGNIPEYRIGGNNRQFFSSVFIYLGRLRGMISDGLLNKMYKELNMM